MTYINWRRPEKDIARNFAMKNNGEDHKSRLCLPGPECICLKTGIETGIIKKSDYIVAVERDSSHAAKIKRFLHKNFKNYILFTGELDKFPMAEMMAAENFPKINFAFLDLCGHFDGNIGNWIFNNRNCFDENCRFGLTIAAPVRLKTWEKTAMKVAMEMGYDSDLENLLFQSKNNLAKDIVGLPIKVSSKRQKIKKNRAAEKVNVILSIKAACNTFMMAFNNMNISVDMLYRYKEKDGKKHTEMVFIDFRFNGPADGDDIIVDAVKEFDKKVSYSSQILRYGEIYTSRKKMDKKPIILKTADAIARHMGIYGNFDSIYDMPSSKRAHIKINANKFGLNPKVVSAKIEKRLQKYGLKA